mgnify:CR=1 FL=1
MDTPFDKKVLEEILAEKDTNANDLDLLTVDDILAAEDGEDLVPYISPQFFPSIYTNCAPHAQIGRAHV